MSDREPEIVILTDLPALARYMGGRARYVKNRGSEIRVRMNRRKLKRATRNDVRETLLLVEDMARTNEMIAQVLFDWHDYLKQNHNFNTDGISFIRDEN